MTPVCASDRREEACPSQTQSAANDRHISLSSPCRYIVYSAAINACEECEQWQQALGLLAGARRVILAPYAITYHAAISACEKSKQWQQAVVLFAEIRIVHVPPNVIACCAAINACEKCEQWQQALSLFAKMRSVHLLPHVIIYNAAISTCEKCEKWQQALGSWRKHEEFNWHQMLLPTMLRSELVRGACNGSRHLVSCQTWSPG